MKWYDSDTAYWLCWLVIALMALVLIGRWANMMCAAPILECGHSEGEHYFRWYEWKNQRRANANSLGEMIMIDMEDAE